MLLLFEEEELVCLHQELATDMIIAVNHQVRHAMFVKHLPGCQPCRTGSGNCHGGAVNLARLTFGLHCCC